jgi:hypothetical protein
MVFSDVAHMYPGIFVKDKKTNLDYKLITANPDSGDLFIRKSSWSSKWVHAYDFMPLLKIMPDRDIEMSAEEFLYFLKEGYDLFGLIDIGEALTVL